MDPISLALGIIAGLGLTETLVEEAQEGLQPRWEAMSTNQVAAMLLATKTHAEASALTREMMKRRAVGHHLSPSSLDASIGEALSRSDVFAHIKALAERDRPDLYADFERSQQRERLRETARAKASHKKPRPAHLELIPAHHMVLENVTVEGMDFASIRFDYDEAEEGWDPVEGYAGPDIHAAMLADGTKLDADERQRLANDEGFTIRLAQLAHHVRTGAPLPDTYGWLFSRRS
jgi:hypothetical protein